MAKVVRKLPMYVRKARLRDYFINKEYQEREKLRYPDCISSYPECKDLKPGNLCSECKSCPHFCLSSFNKLHGGARMKDKKKEDKPVKAKVGKKDKNKERQEKIAKMVENYEHLKPAARAWIKIYADKGLLSDEQMIKVGLEVKSSEVSE